MDVPVVPVAPLPGSPSGEAAPPRARPLLVLGMVALVLAVVVAALVAVWGAISPRLTEEEVDTAVLTTLVSEAEASFLVTGTLEFGTTVERENRQRLTIPLTPLELDVGTTTVTVRVPGRVAYGFDVRALTAGDVRLAEDGVVEVDLPDLVVFSVEPLLERAQVRTDATGWARLDAARSGDVAARALREAQRRMRTQAGRHLFDAEAPRVNAARAVARMLTPALQAAGVAAPRYRIRLGDGAALTLEGEGVEVGGG